MSDGSGEESPLTVKKGFGISGLLRRKDRENPSSLLPHQDTDGLVPIDDSRSPTAQGSPPPITPGTLADVKARRKAANKAVQLQSLSQEMSRFRIEAGTREQEQQEEQGQGQGQEQEQEQEPGQERLADERSPSGINFGVSSSSSNTSATTASSSNPPVMITSPSNSATVALPPALDGSSANRVVKQPGLPAEPKQGSASPSKRLLRSPGRLAQASTATTGNRTDTGRSIQLRRQRSSSDRLKLLLSGKQTSLSSSTASSPRSSRGSPTSPSQGSNVSGKGSGVSLFSTPPSTQTDMAGSNNSKGLARIVRTSLRKKQEKQSPTRQPATAQNRPSATSSRRSSKDHLETHLYGASLNTSILRALQQHGDASSNEGDGDKDDSDDGGDNDEGLTVESILRDTTVEKAIKAKVSPAFISEPSLATAVAAKGRGSATRAKPTSANPNAPRMRHVPRRRGVRKRSVHEYGKPTMMRLEDASVVDAGSLVAYDLAGGGDQLSWDDNELLSAQTTTAGKKKRGDDKEGTSERNSQGSKRSSATSSELELDPSITTVKIRPVPASSASTLKRASTGSFSSVVLADAELDAKNGAARLARKRQHSAAAKALMGDRKPQKLFLDGASLAHETKTEDEFQAQQQQQTPHACQDSGNTSSERRSGDSSNNVNAQQDKSISVSQKPKTPPDGIKRVSSQSHLIGGVAVERAPSPHHSQTSSAISSHTFRRTVHKSVRMAGSSLTKFGPNSAGTSEKLATIRSGASSAQQQQQQRGSIHEGDGENIISPSRLVARERNVAKVTPAAVKDLLDHANAHGEFIPRTIMPVDCGFIQHAAGEHSELSQPLFKLIESRVKTYKESMSRLPHWCFVSRHFPTTPEGLRGSGELDAPGSNPEGDDIIFSIAIDGDLPENAPNDEGKHGDPLFQCLAISPSTISTGHVPASLLSASPTPSEVAALVFPDVFPSTTLQLDSVPNHRMDRAMGCLTTLLDSFLVQNITAAVFHVREGQLTYDEVIANASLTPELQQFVCQLGSDFVDAGTLRTEHEDKSVLFKIVPLLHSAGPSSSLDVRRMLGNMHVCIVFLDPGAHFYPQLFPLTKMQVYIIVQDGRVRDCVKCYDVDVVTRDAVPWFDPQVPLDPIPGHALHEWLSIKLINAQTVLLPTSPHAVSVRERRHSDVTQCTQEFLAMISLAETHQAEILNQVLRDTVSGPSPEAIRFLASCPVDLKNFPQQGLHVPNAYARNPGSEGSNHCDNSSPIGSSHKRVNWTTPNGRANMLQSPTGAKDRIQGSRLSSKEKSVMASAARLVSGESDEKAGLIAELQEVVKSLFKERDGLRKDLRVAQDSLQTVRQQNERSQYEIKLAQKKAREVQEHFESAMADNMRLSQRINELESLLQ